MHKVEVEFLKFINKYKKIKTLNVAYSGGVDSQVLLFLVAKYFQKKTRALHVNHGLSENASHWNVFCKRFSETLGVKFKVAFFDSKGVKSNLEERARNFRYNFFNENIDENCVLLTGHHLDDQAETFMLRLMRGAGVDGLSAMPPERELGNGLLLRPLLTVSKDDIVGFANSVSLKWVEDESNKDTHYDRNFIRNSIIPVLKQRWPNASQSISKSAEHCKVSSAETKKETKLYFNKLIERPNVLKCNKIIDLDENKQSCIIRYLIEKNGFKMPSSKAIKSILNDIVRAKPDSKAVFQMKGYKIRKSFNLLYLTKDSDNMSAKTMNAYVNKEERALYHGKMKKMSYILRKEKVPRWDREFCFWNGTSVVST